MRREAPNEEKPMLVYAPPPKKKFSKKGQMHLVLQFTKPFKTNIQHSDVGVVKHLNSIDPTGVNWLYN